MGRQPRLHLPDTIFHVTGRGVERRRIFVTEGDKRNFVVLLAKSLRAYKCGLLAYCLMPNHYHALIAVGETPLGLPMHDLLTTYAIRFNTQNARDGHLFQSRFYSHPVENLVYLENVIAYIHENPVRAKLAPEVAQWEWSSHRDWETLSSGLINFERLEELVDVPVRALQQAYLERVAGMTAGGSQNMSLAELVADTASMFGITADALRDGRRGGVCTRARGVLIDRALAAGHTPSAVATALGCTAAAVCMARKRSNTCPSR